MKLEDERAQPRVLLTYLEASRFGRFSGGDDPDCCDIVASLIRYSIGPRVCSLFYQSLEKQDASGAQIALWLALICAEVDN